MKAIELMYALNCVGSDFVEEAEFAGPEYTKAKKQYNGISRRFAAVLAAACLVLSLAIAAYATGLFGLADYLHSRGIDAKAVESLTNDMPADGAFYRNQYAQYTVVEAVADSRSIYVAAKVQPLNDGYFLVPEGVFEDDPVAWLGIPGLENENTEIKEYVESLGETYVRVSLGCISGDELITTMKDFGYDESGTLWLYASNSNVAENARQSITCVGTAYTEGMTLPDRVEFDVEIENKSSSKYSCYESFDPAVYAETGILIRALSIEETEMGMYAVFEFENDGSVIETENVFIKLCNENGEELKSLPGTGGTMEPNSAGVYIVSLKYVKPECDEKLLLAVRDVWAGKNYGPYCFSE